MNESKGAGRTVWTSAPSTGQCNAVALKEEAFAGVMYLAFVVSRLISMAVTARREGS
jgi:hypothetical protein